MIAKSHTLFFCFVVCEAIAASGCQQEAKSRPPLRHASRSRRSHLGRPAGIRPSRALETGRGYRGSRRRFAESSASGPSTAGSSATGSAAADSAAGESAGPTGIGAEFGQIDPADLVMPKVLLTRGHAKTCRIGVGDPMPDISLPDVAGRKQSLADLLGERLTVVKFGRRPIPTPWQSWPISDPKLLTASASGVKVVGINERNTGPRRGAGNRRETGCSVSQPA